MTILTKILLDLLDLLQVVECFLQAKDYKQEKGDWLSSVWSGFQSPNQLSRIRNTGVPIDFLKEVCSPYPYFPFWSCSLHLWQYKISGPKTIKILFGKAIWIPSICIIKIWRKILKVFFPKTQHEKDRKLIGSSLQVEFIVDLSFEIPIVFPIIPQLKILLLFHRWDMPSQPYQKISSLIKE